MQNFKRLIATAVVGPDLEQTVQTLRRIDGLCTCGRWLSATDTKWVLVNVHPKRSDIAAVAAYCFECFTKINNTMKSCKDSAYIQRRSEAELRG